MRKRILSLLLCMAMVLSLLPAVHFAAPVKATTSYQYNIVDRADYLYDITWICQKTVSGWCGNYAFNAGTAYHLPYGQPINAGAYIGYGISVDGFISAAKDASSVFYSSRSTYGSTNSVYYATDCSAFVSWCWGIDRKTTYSIPLTDGVSYIGMATAANTAMLQLGDCLNSNDVGHVVLVTDLTYDSSGNLTQIEITEQTPPQLKRSYYTPSQLGSDYGSYYGIYRYSGEVPAAPNAITTEYYPACGSSFTSLYPALESIGVYCDWTLHCEIAELNGITNFSGTVEQNTQLLDLLKAGKLLNPNYNPVVYYPACGDSYTSLYPALESIGINCDWDLHCRIAAANGITGFTGTVEQNTQLLNLLKAGKLINPDGDTGTSGGTGSFVNGYDNGYPGGMAGDGKIYAHGLDVSEWQGASLDFNAIKNAGYDYVILRAGTSYGKDKCFETYYTNARAAGLDIGTYYYTYATSVSAAQTDADNMLSWIKGKTFEYPVYFDYEDSSQDSLSTTTAKNICLTFCDAMAEAGYLAGVYTGYYKSTQLPMDAICAKYEVWIANYWDYGYETLSPGYSTKYGMYQYTDRNYIGSNGPYDGDVAFKDYPSIVRQYGFNGYGNPNAYLDQCTVYPSHCRLITTKSTPLNTLPCSASSSHGSRTLVTAEADRTYTAKALYLNTSGNYWYQITLDTGETAYLYSGHASFQEALGTDLTLSGQTLPGTMTEGDSFLPAGKITASLNQLDSVRVGIFNSDSLMGTELLGAAAEASANVCDLSGLNLDLSTVAAGSYVYMISADYSGYYATSAKEIATYTAQTTLSSTNFVVEPNLTYEQQCDFYPAHCQVTIQKDASVNLQPRTGAELETVQAGQTLTATGLYLNLNSQLWYRVTLQDGQVGYLLAENCSYVQELTGDITLTGGTVPGDMTVGGSFPMAGTLSALYNRLQKVQVTVYSGNAQGAAVLSGSQEATADILVLEDSTLTQQVNFANLPAGTYLYEIRASYLNYFVSGSQAYPNTGTKILLQSSFTVTECAHSFTTAITTAPTCTQPGVLERTCSKCGQVNKSTILALGHSYSTDVIAPTCTQAGYTLNTCDVCGYSYSNSPVPALGHSYSTVYTAPTCTLPGKTAYTCINCADYYEEPVSATGHRYSNQVVAPGCETSGYTLHTCTGCGYSYSDSLTAATGHNYTLRTLDPTCTEPGGTQYTCQTCGDSFLDPVTEATGHSYANGLCTSCGEEDPNYEPPVTTPTLKPSFPTLTFEDVITMNVYFTAGDLTDVADMGLITYSSSVADYSVETAENVIPGYRYSDTYQMYVVSTEGIAAKDMSDVIYFSVYARLSDGSYTYSRLLPYSPTDYAYTLLSSGDADIQKLMVAMLNYGAEAQTFFGYRTDALMNARLTAQQQSMIEAYRSDMMAPQVNADSSKVGIFTNSGGFSRRYPSITFEGAFCINYYFTPSNTPNNGVKLYYWTQADYAAASTLTPANATGFLTMVNDGTGVYVATIEGIAAKDLDKTIYVAGGYNCNGTAYCTGVLAYSIGSYCTDQASYPTALAPFAKATAVYGCYAKEYFYK